MSDGVHVLSCVNFFGWSSRLPFSLPSARLATGRIGGGETRPLVIDLAPSTQSRRLRRRFSMVKGVPLMAPGGG